MGDDHFRRIDHHASIAHAYCHLAAQGFEAGAEHIAERPRAVKAGDLGQLLVQSAYRQVIDTGHSRSQREHTFAAGLDQDLLDNAAAGDQPRTLDTGDIRSGCGKCRGLVHIISGLRPCPDQPLVFKIGVGLQHRGMTDVELRAHLAHRRHTLARLINATPDIFSQLLSDTLVKQKVGHGAALDVQALFLWGTIPEQFRSVRAQLSLI